ncbi:hypothetical protein J7E62_23950 [Variovorax paradoxus]|nr:hypothetical protein [Variovorax paradoxus]
MKTVSILVATPAYNNQVCASYVTSLIEFIREQVRALVLREKVVRQLVSCDGYKA